MTRLTTLDIPSLHRATIGFDRIFNELERQFENSPNKNGLSTIQHCTNQRR